MKIRSITYFDNLQWPLDPNRSGRAGEFISAARKRYEDVGFEVQTTRIAAPPFPLVLGDKMESDAEIYAKSLENQLNISGFDYISIGPAIPESPQSYQLIPGILGNTRSVFSAGIMSSADQGISFNSIQACAAVIEQVSGITSDGFTNLRFAALANVPPGGPFLPAAYQTMNSHPSFAIATEAADLAVLAVQKAGSLRDLRRIFIESVEKIAQSLTQIADELSDNYAVNFSGIDFSLSPYPTADQSIGTAIEGMGVPQVGMHGSLAAVAILADLLDQAQFKKIGFNGLFLTVLEDASLAKHVLEGVLGINDLLLYSTVCGTGLDTIPLPGDIGSEKLYAVLLDLAVLAQRLNKPLTARLMPIPGKFTGDTTHFDFEFFSNSRIMELEARTLQGLMKGSEHYRLAGRSNMMKDLD